MPKFKVRFHNENEEENDVSIEVSDTEYILDAAEKHNLNLPYTCRQGMCGTCVGKLWLYNGEVEQDEQTFLDYLQMKQGYVLLCKAKPKSDCEIDTRKEDDLY